MVGGEKIQSGALSQRPRTFNAPGMFAELKQAGGETGYVTAAAPRRRNSSEALRVTSLSGPKTWALNCSMLRSL